MCSKETMNMLIKFAAMLVLVIGIFAFSQNFSSATDYVDCRSCHSGYPTDSFDQSLNQNPVSVNTCAGCHSKPKYFHGGDAHGNVTYQSGTAWFKSSQSVNYSTANIANIHSRHGVASTVSCFSCHGEDCSECHSEYDGEVASCNSTCHGNVSTCASCHTGTISHDKHNFPGSPTSTCTNANCHKSLTGPVVPEPPCSTACHYLDKTGRIDTAITNSGHGDVDTKHTYSALGSSTPDSPANCTGCHSNNLETEHVGKKAHTPAEHEMACGSCHDFSQYGKTAPFPINTTLIDAEAVRDSIRSNNNVCSNCHIRNGHEDDYLEKHDVIHERFSELINGISCQNCHSSGSLSEPLEGNLSDIHFEGYDRYEKNYDCLTCHSADASNTVKDAVFEGETDCQNCHSVSLETGHSGLGAAHTSAEFQSKSCYRCHKTASLFSIHSPKLADIGQKYCLACHRPDLGDYKIEDDKINLAVGTDDLRCTSCHDKPDLDWEDGHNMEGDTVHNRSFGTYCRQSGCHADVIIINATENVANYHVELLGDNACFKCHDYANEENRKLDLAAVESSMAAGNKSCRACHTVHDGEHDYAEFTTTVLSGTGSLCTDCHGPNARYINNQQNSKPDGSQWGVHPYKRTSDIDYKTKNCATCHAYDGSNAGVLLSSVEEAIGDLSGPACVNCHTQHDSKTGSHLNNDLSAQCSTCHSNVLNSKNLQDFHTGCNNCHSFVLWGAIDWTEDKKDCINCHSVSKEGHGDTSGQHDSEGLNSLCLFCHSSSLTTEHERHKKNCFSCHGSSNSKVTDAIQNGDTACDACHGKSHNLSKLHDSKNFSSNCKSCHSPDLRTEHKNRGKSCNICHEGLSSSNKSIPDKVKKAVKAGNTRCQACHEGHTTGTDDCSSCHSGYSCNKCHDYEAHKGKTQCLTCHSELFGAHHLNKSAKAKDCATCHDSALAHSGSNKNADCIDCHGEVQHKADFDKAVPSVRNRKTSAIAKVLDINNGSGGYPLSAYPKKTPAAEIPPDRKIHLAVFMLTAFFIALGLGLQLKGRLLNPRSKVSLGKRNKPVVRGS